MKNKIEKREQQIKEFVQNCLGEYSVLEHEVVLNCDAKDDYTDFEVIVTNTTNENKICTVLRCHDYEGGIDILCGEDFVSTDEKDFIMNLFLTIYLTFTEG